MDKYNQIHMRTDLRHTSKEETIASVREFAECTGSKHPDGRHCDTKYTVYTVQEWPEPINTWSLVNSWATAARCNEISHPLAHLYRNWTRSKPLWRKHLDTSWAWCGLINREIFGCIRRCWSNVTLAYSDQRKENLNQHRTKKQHEKLVNMY